LPLPRIDDGDLQLPLERGHATTDPGSDARVVSVSGEEFPMSARSSSIRSQTVHGPVVVLVGDRMTIARPTPCHARRHD